MDKREYHRNYYYKRDPEKLNQYRKTYLKRKYYKLKSAVQRAEKYFRNHGRYFDKQSEEMVLKFRAPKKYKNKYYPRYKEKLLVRMNTKYRNTKLKEFVDNVLNLNIPDNNTN